MQERGNRVDRPSSGLCVCTILPRGTARPATVVLLYGVPPAPQLQNMSPASSCRRPTDIMGGDMVTRKPLPFVIAIGGRRCSQKATWRARLGHSHPAYAGGAVL